MPALPNLFSDHIDNARDMIRGRAWVTDAFDTKTLFDQFTVEQLLGDLIPGAIVAHKVARGFSRNHRITSEDGANPEKYHTRRLGFHPRDNFPCAL